MTITIVSGFGRCGSSLVMQMLEAGGMPVTGQWPAFEDDRASDVIRGADLDVSGLDGKAIKVLDPHRGRLPRGPSYRVIWLDRDRKQQALSQIKFFETLTGIPQDRDTRRAFAESYRRDKPKAIRVLLDAGPPNILGLRFEDLLRDPFRSATELAEFCALPSGAVAPMASAVRRRSPDCAPTMELEFALLAERRVA